MTTEVGARGASGLPLSLPSRASGLVLSFELPPHAASVAVAKQAMMSLGITPTIRIRDVRAHDRSNTRERDHREARVLCNPRTPSTIQQSRALASRLYAACAKYGGEDRL
jgi:hypothetical protein